VTRCKSCGAPIVWAVSVNTGKALPLDPEAGTEGNVRLEWTRDGTPYVTVLTDKQRAGHRGALYRSHWATCPDSQSWRR
jgi:hypothetical protein